MTSSRRRQLQSRSADELAPASDLSAEAAEFARRAAAWGRADAVVVAAFGVFAWLLAIHGFPLG